MMNPKQLETAAERLNAISIVLEHQRETLDGRDHSLFAEILAGIIEVVAILGVELQATQQTLQVVAIRKIQQCSECGLPLGSNASTPTADGCHTCTLARQAMHDRRCSDCGCTKGSNANNCHRCAEDSYFERREKVTCITCGDVIGTTPTCTRCALHRRNHD